MPLVIVQIQQYIVIVLVIHIEVYEYIKLIHTSRNSRLYFLFTSFNKRNSLLARNKNKQITKLKKLKYELLRTVQRIRASADFKRLGLIQNELHYKI